MLPREIERKRRAEWHNSLAFLKHPFFPITWMYLHPFSGKNYYGKKVIPLVDWIQDIRELIKQKGVNALILIQSLPPGYIRLHQQ